MISNIQEFMAGCPHFSGFDISVNHLGEDAGSRSVDGLDVQPVIKNYTDGSSLRQFLFAVTLRQHFEQDVDANEVAIGLLEQISDWIENHNNIGILPVLGGNQSPVNLEVINTRRLDSDTTDTVKYQLQCRLVYNQE